MIPRWHWRDGKYPEGPFVSSARILDIPNTVVGAISALPPNCVAMAIRLDPMYISTMVVECERAARRRGLHLFWIKRRVGRL